MTKLTGTVFTFTVSHETFTVSDKTYRCCPVCTYLSFITNCKSFMTDCKSYATDCKSENSTCKFCQLLQSVTIARVAIWLTVTRGVIEIDFVCPGAYEINISVFIHPPGRTKRGANENVSPAIILDQSHLRILSKLLWTGFENMCGKIWIACLRWLLSIRLSHKKFVLACFQTSRIFW